jgi:hypothetical protein
MDVDAVSTPYASSATEHGVDVGFDYSRPLSATRRASVAFSVSSSIVSPTGSAVDKMDPSQAYRLSGDLAVAWDLSRSWSAHATYRRGLEYIPGFTTPVFANGFTAEIAGLCTSRIDVFASVLYSSGVSVISRDALALDTRSADVRIRYAFTSTLAVYGQYLYYFYDSRGNRLLTPGIPPGLERNAIRAGVTLWVRALRR